MILEILTFCRLFFKAMAKSTIVIDLAIRSDGLSLFKSFVPTCKIVWSGAYTAASYNKRHLFNTRPHVMTCGRVSQIL